MTATMWIRVQKYVVKIYSLMMDVYHLFAPQSKQLKNASVIRRCVKVDRFALMISVTSLVVNLSTLIVFAVIRYVTKGIYVFRPSVNIRVVTKLPVQFNSFVRTDYVMIVVNLC